MEVVTQISNKEVKLSDKTAYWLVALNDKNKDKFIKEFYNLNKDKICYVDLTNYDNLYNSTVYLDITNGLKNIEIIKLKGLLDLFKLDLSILKKNSFKLSNSEKKKIVLISAFLSNKEIVIINNSTVGLDRESQLSLIRVIKHEKRNNKIIILYSLDSNFMYEACDKVLDIEDMKMFDKYGFFSKTKRFDKYHMELPDIEKIRKLAKLNKKIKISKVDNISDLIKDVYRNV